MRMRMRMRTKTKNHKQQKKQNPQTAKKTKKRKTFFKYGPKNDWRRFLKREYSSKIEETFRKEMIELGYL